MSRPISRFMYAINYSLDKMCHCFWGKKATKVCKDEEDISRKIVIVTGSNTGIGKEIALQLAKRQATVIMAVRDMEKGRQAKLEIEKVVPNSVIVLKKLDIADVGSIYSFVEDFQAHYKHLHLLVNNAGYMNTERVRRTTKDGFEMHMGVNHLGTFLLTKLLLGSLRKGIPSRIVTLASSNLAIAKLDLDDLMEEKRKKSGDGYREQYNISKLAISVCLRKLVYDIRKNEEYDEGWKQVKFYIMCPGLVRTTLFRHDKGCWRVFETGITLMCAGITAHEGAETACFLSLSRSVAENDDKGNGEIYRFRKVWKKGEKLLKEIDGTDQQDKLYKMTEEFLQLGQEFENQSKQDEKDDTTTVYVDA